MEKIIVTIFMGLLASFSGNAQSQYELKMTEALELWDAQKAPEAAALFEEIATAEEDNWLPYYYAAQVKVIDAFSQTSSAVKEKQLQEAQKLLDEAVRLSEKEVPENLVLQAMLHTGYLTLDPMKYGPQLPPVIISIYEKAATRYPENPRVALEHAEWKIGAARYYGEDPTQYCDELKASLKLFGEQPAAEPFAPQWGEERAKMLLDSLCGAKDNAGN